MRKLQTKFHNYRQRSLQSERVKSVPFVFLSVIRQSRLSIVLMLQPRKVRTLQNLVGFTRYVLSNTEERRIT